MPYAPYTASGGRGKQRTAIGDPIDTDEDTDDTKTGQDGPEGEEGSGGRGKERGDGEEG